MAISYLGTVKVDASAASSSSSITIPSGATLAVAMLSFWDSGWSQTQLASLSIDGQSVTKVIDRPGGANDDNALYGGTVTGFSTGASKTVSWAYDDTAGGVSEGGTLFIAFFSGASATLVATDEDAVDGAGLTASISLNNTATDQVAVVHASAYSSASKANISTPSGSTRTLVYDGDAANSVLIDFGYYTFSTTGAKTYSTQTCDWPSIMGVLLEPDAVGGSTFKGLTLLGVG